MTLNIMLPGLGREKNVKDCVIFILSAEWPLTGKKIYNRIRKQHELPVTYQAVHKTLKKLIEDEVLVKTGKDYKLNEEWLEQIRDFGTELGASYKEDKTFKKDVFPQNLIFNNLFDVYMFILEALDVIPTKENNSVTCFRDIHMWNPVIARKKEIEKLKKVMKKNDVFILSKGNTQLDEICKKYWESIGMKVTVGVDSISNHAIVVIGDYTFQIFYPENVLKEIQSIYKNIKSLNDMDFTKFHKDFYFKKSRINVLVNKNQEIADSIRNDTLKYFDKDYASTASQNHFTFSNQIEMGNFLVDLLERDQDAKEPITANWSFMWCPLFLPKKKYIKLKELLSKRKMHILCKTKTAWDEWLLNLWKDVGAEVM